MRRGSSSDKLRAYKTKMGKKKQKGRGWAAVCLKEKRMNTNTHSKRQGEKGTSRQDQRCKKPEVCPSGKKRD